MKDKWMESQSAVDEAQTNHEQKTHHSPKLLTQLLETSSKWFFNIRSHILSPSFEFISQFLHQRKPHNDDKTQSMSKKIRKL